VREKMTAWIQQNYPDTFPTTRFTAKSDLTPGHTENQTFARFPTEQHDGR
jgi:hypothetical protein